MIEAARSHDIPVIYVRVALSPGYPEISSRNKMFGGMASRAGSMPDKDFALKVLSDACIDPDPEVHRVLIEKVFPKQAEVLTADEWVNDLN